MESSIVELSKEDVAIEPVALNQLVPANVSQYVFLSACDIK